MDNISHALAGLLIAEAALLVHSRGTEGPARGLRLAACGASIAASNLPDLDFVYTAITGGKLGYLLHHRGHTHTIVAALGCALLVVCAVWLLFRSTRSGWSRRDWALLGGLSVVGSLGHLALDFSNNYGVHPFWPFDSSWYYGDTIFIIEPWFWVTTLPALAYLAHSKAARFILLLLSAGMLVLVWLVPMVQAWSAAAVTLATLAALAVLRRRSPAARVGFALVSSLFVLVTFATLSRVARASAQGATRAHFAPTALLDVALTPAPASPLCFSAIVLTLEGDAYVTRTATIAPLPALMDPRACRSMYVGETARLAPTELEARAHGTLFRGELRARAHELGALAAADCRVRAFLRFARAPFWRRQEVSGVARVHEGKGATTTLVIGDLRYDRDVSLGFAELALEPDDPRQTSIRCPRFVPPWSPPRTDLTERVRLPVTPGAAYE